MYLSFITNWFTKYHRVRVIIFSSLICKTH